MMNNSREKAWAQPDRSSQNVYGHNEILDKAGTSVHAREEGQLIYYTEDAPVYIVVNNVAWYLPARHFMWVPAGICYSIHSEVSNIILQTISFQTQPHEDVFFSQIGIYPVNDLLLEMIDFTKKWEGRISPDDENRFSFIMAIKAILPEVSKHKLPFSLPFAKDSRLQKIVTYIQNNISEDLVFSNIAQQFGLSERSLARLFQSDLKMSYIKYLRTFRMIRAIELLTTTNLSINEIAFHVGYNSFPTFSNTFFQIVGTRPKSYIQQRT